MDHDTGALVDRASQGDGGAIEALLARWMPAVERYLRARAPRDVLARESGADLAQSVCREALERIERGGFEYQGEAAFKQWLYGAADLKLKGRLRHVHAEKRDAGREAPLAPEALREALDRSRSRPSRAVMREEEAANFAAALQRLDERGREVLTRFHFEGQTHEQIAQDLEIEVSHSRTILARALARVTRVLREGG